jgi:predicted GIY-YIG superfamily endonuclease
VILKEKGQYVLYSHNGSKVLGKFKSKTEAMQREREVKYFADEKKPKKKK